jgi:hypothetical protein
MESRMLVLGAVGDALFPPLPAQAAAADAALDPATAQLLRHAGASDEVILKASRLLLKAQSYLNGVSAGR